MTLEIKNLSEGYHGVTVIKNLNLEIKPGEAVDLIGLNGAGKSTTIKHILGLLRPQEDLISLNGLELTKNPDKFKQQLTYIPEVPVLYPELTLKEHIDLTILAYELSPEKAWKKANELLKIFRLDNKLDWLPIHFSKGMKQKVMLITAFMTDAELLVIDEPFTGLDPLSALSLTKLINKAIRGGRMVLMTSHVLSEVQTTISKFAVLNNGCVEASGSLDEIRHHYGLSSSDSFDKIYEILSREQVQNG